MTRDDIIRMAAEAGFAISKWDDGLDEVMDGDNYHIQTDQVIDFANLVAAAEREACAQVCENMSLEWQNQPNIAQAELATIMDCALAIRARGEK